MSRAGRPAGGFGGRLLFLDAPDPRLHQTVFALLVALDLTLRIAGGATFGLDAYPALALMLALAGCALALVVPWGRVDHRWIGALPLLDIGTVSLSRLSEHNGAAAALIVLPAFWLGGLYGRRGAALAFGAALVLVTLPGLAYLGVGQGNLSRSLLLALTAGWSALAIAVALERLEEQRVEAEARGQALEEAVDTIGRQQGFADAILDTVDVGLVLLDSRGAYVGLNRRHQDFMRLAFPEGHAGRAGQLGLVFGPDGETPLAREDMPTWRAAQGEEFDDCRIWVGDDPLTMRALSVSARSVRDPHGGFGGAALAYKDVTDFMRALQVKDEFVASVSHELRTPLTSIIGYVDLLRDDESLGADQQAQLEVVARNGDRLRRLVADLLHTAQADDGPVHIVRAPTDVAAIVRDAVEAAQPGAKACGVEIASDVPDALPATVDPQRFAQVVDNLLSNAVKYSVDGGEVRVELHVDGRRLDLSVSDDGIGISPQDRDRLFTRFFRSSQAQERTIQGVGLGLSITRSIVESHGGRIEVESELGRGSTFRVRLPLS